MLLLNIFEIFSACLCEVIRAANTKLLKLHPLCRAELICI